LDVAKERFNLIQITTCQLIFRNEPSHRVKINSDHLHPQPRTLDQRCATTHKNIKYAQLSESPRLLVVAVVMVPYPLCSLGRIARRFCGSSDKMDAEATGTPARPPLGHLIDGLTGIAF